NNFADDSSILCEEVELSIINEPREFQADNIDKILKPLAPSIQKQTTLVIRNQKRNITKELNRDNDWKRCDFVKACIEQNIHLDNNAELNKKNIYL
ncbi:14133_t:CDS:2, partial [Racocetra persica]